MAVLPVKVMPPAVLGAEVSDKQWLIDLFRITIPSGLFGQLLAPADRACMWMAASRDSSGAAWLAVFC